MKRRPRDYAPEGPIELLKAILEDSPKLTDAQCRGHEYLFDPQAHGEAPQEAAGRHASALAKCAACPALEACSAWLDRLAPHQRPAGVVAGHAPRLAGRPAA